MDEDEISPEKLSHIATRLADSTLNVASRLEILVAVKEKLVKNEQHAFVEGFMPILCMILCEEDVVFDQDSERYKFRVSVIETLSRIPVSSWTKTSVSQLVQTFLRIMARDNEDMGVAAITLLHGYVSGAASKSSIPSIGEELMPYIVRLLESILQAVATAFEKEPSALEKRFVYNFKLMTALPKLVASIVVSGLPIIHESSLQQFATLLVRLLEAAPPLQLEARAKGLEHCISTASMEHRAVYIAWKTFSIKLVNPVLFYLRKTKPQIFEPYRTRLVVSLLAHVIEMPDDCSSVRREALNNIRLVVNSTQGGDLRSFFAPHFDVLLNDSLMLGTSVTTRTVCEYTSAIVVADLVVGIRKSLTVAQTRRVLYLFLKKAHNLRIPQQAALHSFKLIILLFEHLATIKSEPVGRDDARDYIMEFIRTVTARIEAMNNQFKQICALYRNPKKNEFTVCGSLDTGIPFYQQCGGGSGSGSGTSDAAARVQEMKMMFRLMVNSLKHALAALMMHYNPPMPANTTPEVWNAAARGFRFHEYPIFSSLLKEGLRFFDYMHLDDFDEFGEWQGSHTPSSPMRRKEVNINKEDQDAVETLSQIFSCLDPNVFLDVMSANIEHIFHLTAHNDYIPFFLQHFVLLTTNNISYHVSAMLFEYMRTHLGDLGKGNATVAAALIRWLKLICSGMAVYGSKNDAILQPHLSTLIMDCIKLPREAKDPVQFFAFLRVLFRSISGGKFENLYNQIVPIMPELLQALSELLGAAHRPQLKDILVELILTVPVRLSHLLPYLSFLMRPLVYALQQRHGEMVSHALKTLDLILDNLAEQYLNPILSPYREELMAALFKHLRPPPYRSGLSHPTVKLLGKLSGRNRKWLKNAPELAFHESCEPGLQVIMQFVDVAEALPKTFAFDRVLETVKVLLETTAVEVKYRLLGYDFAKGCIPLLLELDFESGELESKLLERVAKFRESLTIGPRRKRAWDESTTAYSGPPILLERKQMLEKTVCTIVECLALSCRLEDVRDEARALLQDVSRHFALLYIEETTDLERPYAVSPRALELLNKKQVESLSPSILNRMRQQMTMDLLVNKAPSGIEGFTDSVTKAFGQDGNGDVGSSMLQTVYDTLLLFFKDKDIISGLSIWSSVAEKCCSSFDKSPWFVKAGGIKALQFLIKDLSLGRNFLLSKQPTIVKALLALIRDPAPETVLDCISEARSLLFDIIDICHSQSSSEKLSSSSSFFRPMVNHLVAALSDSSKHVRQTVQTALKRLSQVTNLSIYSLTSKSVEDRLLIPIFSKPLRALPFSKQIVHMDAITFCLKQEPPLVPFSDGFHRFLVEVISIADAEDQGLLNKSQKLKSTLLLSDLRVACLQFLSAARVHSSLFQNPTMAVSAKTGGTNNTSFTGTSGVGASKSSVSNSAPQGGVNGHGNVDSSVTKATGALKDSTNETRIFTIYLKYLVYSDSESVVEAAVEGLLQLIKVQRPPKEILPQALKPVLQNLTNPKDLKLQSLVALKRLLGPLITFFKAELGNRLLDHLKFWAEHADFTATSGKHISQVDSVKLIVALLDIFNSLSSSASVFLSDLVNLTLEKLDVSIQRTSSSPFRSTLVTFLVKYPDLAVSFFLDNLAKPTFVDFFLDILSTKDSHNSAVLLHTLIDHLALLFQRILEQPELTIPGTRILLKLVELEGAGPILGNDQGAAVLQLVLDKWNVIDSPSDARMLLSLLMAFYESQPNHGSLLTVLLQSIDQPLVLNTLPVQQFLYDKVVAKCTSGENQLSLFEQFIAQWDTFCDAGNGNFQQVSRSQWKQMHSFLTFVLVPLVLRTSPEVLGKLLSRQPDIGLGLAGHIWGPLSVSMDQSPQSRVFEQEQFLLELQGLTFWLMEYAGPSLTSIRKELIKFTWVSMKVPDIIMKATAALVSAQFSASYETPSRIAYIVYTNLLQSVSHESLPLVRRGLNLLTPRLPELLFKDESFTQRLLEQVVKFVKDETPYSSLYSDIFCSYPDIWVKWRHVLSPLLLTYLSKISTSAFAENTAGAGEGKYLPLELLATLLKWYSSLASEMEVDGNAKSIGNQLASTLVRYISFTMPVVSSNGLETAPSDLSPTFVNRGLELLESTAKAFPEFSLEEASTLSLVQSWAKFAQAGSSAVPPSPPVIALNNAMARLGQALSVIAQFHSSAVVEGLYPVIQGLFGSSWIDVSVAQSFAPLFERLSEYLDVGKQMKLLDDKPTPTIGSSGVAPVIGDESVMEIDDEPSQATEYSDADKVALSKPTAEDAANTDSSPTMDKPSSEELISQSIARWLLAHLDSKAKNGWSNTYFLCILYAFTKSGKNAEIIDNFLPILVKWFQALVKEHINSRGASTTGTASNAAIGGTSGIPSSASASASKTPTSSLVPSAVSNTNASGSSASTSVAGSMASAAGTSSSASSSLNALQPNKSQGLSYMLQLMGKRCALQTTPLRKTLLVQLYSLIDKSTDVGLLRQILNFAVSLVFEHKQSSVPTFKEKAMLLNKMFIFEFRADRKLLEEYLQVILRIYSDPDLSQTELSSYLENAFLLGIKSENYQLRLQFAAKLDSSVLPNVSVRLSYLLGIQSWEPLANTFWIRQMLDMLFGSVVSDSELYKIVGNYRLAAVGHSLGDCQTSGQHEAGIKIDPQTAGANKRLAARVEEFEDDSKALRVSKRTNLRSADLTAAEDDLQTVCDSKSQVDADNSSDDPVRRLLQKHNLWISGLKTWKLDILINSTRQIIYLDNNLAAETWIQLFPLCWSVLSGTQRLVVGRMLTQVLVKDYHVKQADMRPNCVQTLVESVARCYPTLALPPFVLRMAGSKFNAWHAALEILQNSTPELRVGGLGQGKDDEKIREQSLDAIQYLYQELGEEDYYYGLWKRRCNFAETNVALAYEQLGMWSEAQTVLEKAQAFARGSGTVASGTVPFCESEYGLWETHWIHCAKQLQQWDILADLAKQEGNHSLLLECAWRLSDFVSEREHLERTFLALGESLSLHGKLCETFFVLANGKGDDKSQREFNSMTEEVVQLSLRKWHMLPSLPSALLVTSAHLPLLHLFQLLVELGDARSIQSSLLQTGPNNIESKAAEIKTLLDRWRWRLPNQWDDISQWSDLVSWRQHVFTMLNKKYIPIAQSISQLNPTQNVSYLYKGYHETAWTINRFAHILRKAHLTQVCLQQLNKIYTLPNIEIQEAFYKLREHARCFLEDPSGYAAGLEVINNTNLTYFLPVQKAEFMTLRGQFLALLNRPTDAFQSFSQGLRLNDLAKGWQQWGLCNCNLFKDDSKQMEYGIHAMECCLKAASVFNNHNARPMLARSLWLLISDDSQGTFAQIFLKHAPHTPIWFWNTFIPQLLNGLANTESLPCKFVLQRLAKTYPQSLFFPLRTMSDDLIIYKKALLNSVSSATRSQQDVHPTADSSTSVENSAMSKNPMSPILVTSSEGSSSTGVSREPANDVATSSASGAKTEGKAVASSDGSALLGTSNGTLQVNPEVSSSLSSSSAASAQSNLNANLFKSNDSLNERIDTKPATPSTSAPAASSFSSTGASATSGLNASKSALESLQQTLKHCDDISATLKTATPLLALSMESLCDQIMTRLKLGTDEDIYRLIVTFYNEQASVLASRIQNPNDDLSLSSQTRNNLARFAGTMYPNHIKYQDAFKRAFIDSKPDLPTLLARLRQWRDHLELMLDSRPEQHVLTHFSPYLAEFEHSKFDDIEIPGQYLQLKDSNIDFIRIENVESKFTISRGHTACYRTLVFRGHDGHAYPFKIVNPTPRSSRREERLVQFYTLVNDIFEHRRECRRRRLSINLPSLVPISNVVRLASTDFSNVSLYQIYEQFCLKANQSKDLPYDLFTNSLSKFVREGGQKSSEQVVNYKVELLEQIANELVPDTVLSLYFSKRMKTVSDFWYLRKQFASSLATNEFMNYTMAIANRTPQKVFVSCRTGNVLGEELWPNFLPTEQVFRKDEEVPFKLTPNIQNMLTLVGLEGIYSTALIVLARSLLEKHREDLDAYLPLLMRDALIYYSTGYRTPVKEGGLPSYIYQSINAYMQRLNMLSCGMLTNSQSASSEQVDTSKPVNQMILEMIAASTNPINLASMDPNWMPWY